MPLPPACEQVFNIFNLADPFAYRLEPLLDVSFEHIPVVHLPISATHSSDQWQSFGKCLSLATADNGLSLDHQSKQQQSLRSPPSSFSAPHLQSAPKFGNTDEQILGWSGVWYFLLILEFLVKYSGYMNMQS